MRKAEWAWLLGVFGHFHVLLTKSWCEKRGTVILGHEAQPPPVAGVVRVHSKY